MNLISVENVSFGYSRDRLVLDGVSLAIRPGASVGLVGESGSGKTTLLRLLLGLTRPSSGQIRFDGATLDVRSGGFMRNYRRQVQAVFQDPYSSLDPRQNVLGIVSEPLRSLGIPGNRRELVEAALVSVGLEPGILGRYPHEFSGGQRQRIVIARALAVEPEFLVADEPVSALDVSIQAQVLNLMRSLQRDLDLTYLFISHDLAVVRHVCDRIAVMQAGQIVELADAETLYRAPQHPYTQTLLAASVTTPPRHAAAGRTLVSSHVPEAA